MPNTITAEDIRNELIRLAPFHHDIELPYGLRTHLPELSRRSVERTRLRTLVNHAFPSLLGVFGGSLQGLRVLDVGCNCGGFSFEAIKNGAAYVLGIDVVDHYLQQANFIKRVLQADGAHFKMLSADDIEKETTGEFDLTLCLGILYHLENPVLTMKKIASVTQRAILVDTKVFRNPFVRGPAWLMNFPPGENSDSKNVSTSLWRKEAVCQFTPNAAAVTSLLQFLGFSKVKQLEPKEKNLEKRYYQKKRVTFLAIRD
ncbi:MAG: DUF1698 domain-containing protein [Deltaproteobacteria bacterium]|nr:DUF1698 domain-containing protein [Deltaproteobacteria bacterium]